MKKISILFFLIILGTNVYAEFSCREMLHLSWGTKASQAELRQTPGGRFGPMAFSVQNDTIFLLDTQNKSLKIFCEQQLINSIQISEEYADDFAWQNGNHYYLLANNKMLEFQNQQLVWQFQPESPRQLISRIVLQQTHKQPWLVLNYSRSIQPMPEKHTSLNTSSGVADGFANFVLIEKLMPRTVKINRSDNSRFQILSQHNDLGTVRFVGSSPDGNLYIYVEQIVNHLPLKIKREIRLYEPDGSIKAVFLLPPENYTFIFREFFVDANGNFFHLLTTKNGVDILGWFDDRQKSFEKRIYRYPSKFEQNYRSEFTEPDKENSETKKNEKDAESKSFFDTITRDRALATADAYVQHVWTADFRNLSNGLVRDPAGVAVQTPAWVQVGTNRQIPYQWGGSYSLAEFDQRLAQGYYAGDIATSGVSQYASGVDCSGFVSQCWDLPFHYSTAAMEEFITQLHHSWFDLQPADVIHTVGHVRLFVGFNSDGSLLTVESAANDWRVSYRNYSLSQLNGYSPRYYIYMEGMPGSLPQPNLSAVSNGRLRWQLSTTENVAGQMVYQSSDGTTWQPLLSSGMYAADLTSLSVPLVARQSRFYKVISISAEDLVTESFDSDSYGYFVANSSANFLIVDGFHRTSGSYVMPWHNFAVTWGQALANFDYSFETASNEAVLNNQIQLTNYDAVFWLLGDEGEADETFSSAEQVKVKTYLQQGGKLFVSGSEIGWDLDERGSASDQDFLHRFLKTQYSQDDAANYSVTGQPGTVFSSITARFDDGTHGIYPEDYPDALQAVNGSFAAMSYANGLVAATAFSGKVPQATQDAQIFVLGFPFETIYRSEERIQLMGKVLEFFGFSTVTSVAENSLLIEKFQLAGNFPNPFNSGTIIKYYLPKTDKVTLRIFDVLAREVFSSFKAEQSSGWHSVHWNGQNLQSQNVSSGIYFYRIQAGEWRGEGRMAVVR